MLSLLLCASVVVQTPRPAVRFFFPKDPSVLNAKSDFGAKGDGKTDDTEALQRALDASCGIGGKTKALFLPNGVYRVTQTLVVKSALGPWLYGETRDGVILRLDSGVKNVNSVLRTHPNEKGPTSADWFMRNLRNFTVDVGNNPEVDGIRYYATNSGILQNVKVIGRGKVGINAGFLDQSGPNLIQDAVVDGFETGIQAQWIWGTTLSRITVRNCRKVGVYVNATPAAIEDLTVENTPVAINGDIPNDWGHWSGVTSIIGGKFTGNDKKQPAILNKGVLFARNVTTKGFAKAIQSTSAAGDLEGPAINEYASHIVPSIFPTPAKSLNLPIKPEPAIAWETAPAKWVSANDFGAIAGDNKDDTQAIQDAIDYAASRGATFVTLRGIGGGDPNWYNVDGVVKVHGSVRMIMGLGFGRILGGPNGKFVVSDTSAPVVKFQNIDAFGGRGVTVENQSKSKTLLVESCGLTILGTGTGDIFATDFPGRLTMQSPGQSAWCRQLNPEGNDDTGLVRNTGANVWALGVKSEGPGVKFLTREGGRTEIHGMFMYGPGIAKDDQRPMFDIRNASFSVTGLREIVFGGDTFHVKVRQTSGGQTKIIDSNQAGGWIGWPLFVARK
ncbi:MAG: glycosyl hydrolase family 28-related protein [Fimbriimonas sp.]